jgi:hypothetical protein
MTENKEHKEFFDKHDSCMENMDLITLRYLLKHTDDPIEKAICKASLDKLGKDL